MAVESLLDALTLADSAICHQSSARGVFGEGAHLPLCARCVGLHLGLWTGLLWWWMRRPLPAVPSGALRAALGLAVLATALNIALPAGHLTGDPAWVRVLIGAGLGYGLAGLSAPLVSRTRAPATTPPASTREVVRGALLALAGPCAFALSPVGPWVAASSLPLAVLGLATVVLFWFVALGTLPRLEGRAALRGLAATVLAAAQVAGTLWLRGASG